jgi:hypothetical protein
VVAVPRRTNLNGDIQLAVASIAAEFRVDFDALPKEIRERILGTMRALSAAHYNAGVRDAMVRFGNHAAVMQNESIASPTDVTPVVGPHGRKMRASKMPTPIVPPPRERGQTDEDDDTKS